MYSGEGKEAEVTGQQRLLFYATRQRNHFEAEENVEIQTINFVKQYDFTQSQGIHISLRKSYVYCEIN